MSIPFEILLQFKFTQRESQIALLIPHGKTNKEICKTLAISEKTVKFHIGNIYKKCKIKCRKELIELFDKLCKG